MVYFELKITRDGALARIDRNRPDEGNSLKRAMLLQLSATLRDLGSKPDVRVVTLGLASKVLPQATFAADSDAFLKKLAARPCLILETIKRYQAKVSQLTPDMASEYAGTLLALVRF